MKNPSFLRRITVSLCALLGTLALSTPASAGHWVGYRGGWHHGGYGYWHGGWGWGWHGGWGPWGWYWGGLGLGLYYATLPHYYTTYYWGGVPYYYANYTYYQWDPNMGQYVTVAPPSGVARLRTTPTPAGAQPAPAQNLIVYPKNGQSQEQTGTDKFECHKWAREQTGFDPTEPGGGAAP